MHLYARIVINFKHIPLISAAHYHFPRKLNLHAIDSFFSNLSIVICKNLKILK